MKELIKKGRFEARKTVAEEIENKKQNELENRRQSIPKILTESYRARTVMKFNPNYICKAIILGDKSIGKSCLLHRMHRNEFRLQKPKIGSDIVRFDATLADGTRTRLEVWNNLGSDIGSTSSLYYRGSIAAIICFNLTDRKSFENIARWDEEFKRHYESNKEVVKYLVGLQSDLVEQSCVSDDEITRCEKKHNFDEYFPTSAKTGENV